MKDAIIGIIILIVVNGIILLLAYKKGKGEK